MTTISSVLHVEQGNSALQTPPKRAPVVEWTRPVLVSAVVYRTVSNRCHAAGALAVDDDAVTLHAAVVYV